MHPLRRSRSSLVRIAGGRLSCEGLEGREVPVTVTVNATAGVHADRPERLRRRLWKSHQLADLNAPLNRNGGNASDTYSYAQDATNRGSDWFFESIASGTGNGQGMDAWITETRAGGAQPSVTVNLFDWAAKVGTDRSILGSFRCIEVRCPAIDRSVVAPNWGNGVRTNGTNITGNNPNDAYVPNTPRCRTAWIQHLIDTFGNSQTGGVQYYTLGNEPGLWNHTHRDIHPAGKTMPELRDRIIAYASDDQVARPGRESPRAGGVGLDELLHQRGRRRRRELGSDLQRAERPSLAAQPAPPARHGDTAGGCSTTSRCTTTRRAASSATTCRSPCSCCATAPPAACGTRTTSIKAGSPAPASTAARSTSSTG